MRSVLVSYGSTGRANRLTPPSQCQRSEYGSEGSERPRFRISCPISVDDAGLLRRSSRLQPAFALRATARSPSSLPRAKASGADRDRTDDLKLAKLALSQLSYGPVRNRWRKAPYDFLRRAVARQRGGGQVGLLVRLRPSGYGVTWLAEPKLAANGPPSPVGLRRGSLARFASEGWWARDELNVRPHAYQACALTT